MEQFEHTLHYPNENSLSSQCGFAACRNSRLCQLNIPVAVYVPNKIVKLLNSNAQLKCFKILINLLGESVESGNYPLVFNIQLFRKLVRFEIVGQIHHDKPCGVPYLVCKVSACLDLFFNKSHIVSGGISCSKHKSQGVCAILVDYQQRVNSVAQ